MNSALCEKYDRFVGWFSWMGSPLFLFLRLYFGFSFAVAGWSKLTNLSDYAASFEGMGIWMPGLNAGMVGFFELVGGLFLMVGFASRLSGLMLAIIMVFAYYFGHYDALTGFGRFGLKEAADLFVNQHPFMFLVTSLLVLVHGPGYFAVDTWLHPDRR